jgi:osmoprotectant transport system permease protein
LYPEYTGTAFLVILKADEATQNKIMQDSQAVYEYVKTESQKRHKVIWLSPLGFNNTYALMMRKKQAEAWNIKNITDLKNYIDR